MSLSAGIAAANPAKAAWAAFRYAKGMYVIPLMFAYTPLLALDQPVALAETVIAAGFGFVALGGVLVGYLLAPLSTLDRVLLLAAALALFWPLPEAHGYLLNSPPIRGALDPALSELEIEQGNAKVEANLQLPLKDLASRTIEVDVDITDGILQYADVFDRLTDIEGRLSVKGTDAFADGLTGKVLDQPIRFDVAPYQDLGVRANMRIDTTSEALIEGLGLPLKRYCPFIDKIGDFAISGGPRVCSRTIGRTQHRHRIVLERSTDCCFKN